MTWTIHRLTVASTDAGQRLDQYLASACPNLSRTAAKKVIDLGGVHLAGRRTRGCSRIVRAGELVEVYIDNLPLDPFRISAADIVYQDTYLIVLNKPASVDTQPTHARFKGTVYEALQQHLQDPFRPHLKPDLGMVQRLDRGTSGLMVFSTHQKAHKKLTQIFVEHQVQKHYLALAAGTPNPAVGEIRSFLARSRQQNRVGSVASGGKEAITRYRMVKDFREAALVDVELLTGRSHQIRVHMSEQGWPLLGDTFYGGPRSCCQVALERPLLHAASLAFTHPVTDERLEFSCDVPADFSRMLEVLQLESDKDS